MLAVSDSFNTRHKKQVKAQNCSSPYITELNLIRSLKKCGKLDCTQVFNLLFNDHKENYIAFDKFSFKLHAMSVKIIRKDVENDKNTV